MRRITLFLAGVLAVLLVPSVVAVSTGTGISVDIQTEDFAPQVWQCNDRVVFDDNTEPGRITRTNQLIERRNNYAFEGEQIQWKVLVMDKNGINKVQDVFVTIGSTQGEGNDIEVNCVLDELVDERNDIDESCNARIGEDVLDDPDVFHEGTAAFYTCTFTVESPDSMYGEYFITAEAVDNDGLSGTMDENEYWFLNPIIALSITGDLTFEDVRPGTQSYSDTILVGNDADEGSGVMLDMFISGTDFYDSSSSGAACPDSNVLRLDNFAYFATNGVYNSKNHDPRPDKDGIASNDAEGYVGIEYGTGFNDPLPFYNRNEIIQGPALVGGYYPANILAPGAEMALTFRLSLPEPCNGDFDTGSIFFWGEAI